MKLDTKRVCREIETAIGFPKGLTEGLATWTGLQIHADGPRSQQFTIHALAATTIQPVDHWREAVTKVLAKHKVRDDGVSIQSLSTFEDVAKDNARPCSVLLQFMNSDPELVEQFRQRPTTLIVADVSRKERLLLWFLFSE